MCVILFLFLLLLLQQVSTLAPSCAADLNKLTWQQVSPPPSFAPRYAFGVANTGTQLVMTGGLSSSKTFPAAASLRSLPQANATTHQHTYGDVWCSNNGERLELTTTTPGFQPRAYHSSVFYSGSVYVLGGALVQMDGTIEADGQVWYASSPYTNWTKGNYQLKDGKTTDVAPWNQRFAAAASVASDRVFLFGGVAIAKKGNKETLAFYSDLWVTNDPASTWALVQLKPQPATMTGRTGAVLYDTTFILGQTSALFAYGGGVLNKHDSGFTDDIVELVPDVSVNPTSSSAQVGGQIIKDKATTFGRTMTSISVFHSNFNPLHPTPISTTLPTSGLVNYLLMTGGSTYGTEQWKLIDDVGHGLPILTGSQNMECSIDGKTWEQTNLPAGAANWKARSGHWTGWFQGKTIMLGGTSGVGNDYNDVWLLKPRVVVQMEEWKVAGIAVGKCFFSAQCSVGSLCVRACTLLVFFFPAL